MSNQAATDKTTAPAARRERIRIRVESLRRAPKLGILGLPELIALGTSFLLLAIVIFIYLYLFVPASARHVRALEQREALQKRLRDAQAGFNVNASTGATVAEIDKTLQEFEETKLSPGGEGRMAIYQELNDLIRRNNLRATGGIKYSSLDALGEQTGTSTQSNPRTGNAKWQSVYPGLGVSLTVEGQYSNVRRFVRDIEASRQFVIINAVELEGANDAAARTAIPTEGGAANTSAPPSSIVSLRLDMAAYFRRSASNTGTEQPQPTGTP
ncbi:MAG TPA: GspMb/PilO family protein [Pyrinomonadaceae bacterium]|nr:GspMb/PilO family protein [Pyrinomonadaceae bacterium]